MSKKKIYFFLFILGLSLGIFWGINKVRASSPEGETSGGEQPASVYYDEYWQATRALVYIEDGMTQGFEEFTDFNEPTPTTTTTKHKMVVTKWKVHGHIHFP